MSVKRIYIHLRNVYKRIVQSASPPTKIIWEIWFHPEILSDLDRRNDFPLSHKWRNNFVLEIKTDVLIQPLQFHQRTVLETFFNGIYKRASWKMRKVQSWDSSESSGLKWISRWRGRKRIPSVLPGLFWFQASWRSYERHSHHCEAAPARGFQIEKLDFWSTVSATTRARDSSSQGTKTKIQIEKRCLPLWRGPPSTPTAPPQAVRPMSASNTARTLAPYPGLR